ncbi:hypothetical protein N7537_006201 [Penicillium hordei]|uniref:Uncharacterized protein n=1 Tax=Penicillium hordei TaxID=40994 RepID=A0AAD6E7P3_9EURO|nr:uncharacterized protein N7537_006201 [Penicillium hordei]KAJ5603245.1 hypothetical protein N7537_006201 [Penicillium hordei]
MPSWVLFPRLHLAEVEDQSWCPSWLREHTHRALSRMWQASNSNNGSPAAQACDLLLKVLGGSEQASQFTIVDACAGAGGPTPVLAPTLNAKLIKSGYQPVEFVLTDLWPDIRAWEKIVKRSEHISYIEEPIDATKSRRLAKPGTKECRIFNLCFHHFDDPAAKKVLASAVKSADAFMIIEMTHRTLPSLLNTTFVILSVFFTTLYDFYWSPKHLLFTYLIPIVPLFYAIDGYVSCTRGRTPDETWALLKCQPDLDLSQWELKSGEQTALLPFGRMYWYSGVKKTTK